MSQIYRKIYFLFKCVRSGKWKIGNVRRPQKKWVEDKEASYMISKELQKTGKSGKREVDVYKTKLLWAGREEYV